MIQPTEQAAGAAPPPVRFPLGELYSTPAALAALTHEDIARGLARHLSGDWGDLSADDIEENELSLREGFRLLSAYQGAEGTKFWIITEADRSVTTVLLPDDY